MDPNACFAELLESLESLDLETAAERLADLSEWMGRGGFAPDTKAALVAAAARVSETELSGRANG